MSTFTGHRRQSAVQIPGLTQRLKSRSTRRKDAAHEATDDHVLLRALLFVAVPAVLLLVTGMLAGVPPRAGEIERGVHVGGQRVDGGNWERAATDLSVRFDGYLDEPLVLQIGNQQAEVLPSELGIAFDVEATYERALQVGRGQFVTAGAERLKAHLFGVEVDPVISLDDERFAAMLRELGAGTIKPPRDAKLVLDGGKITIQPSAEGSGIDAEAAAAQVRRAVVGLDHGPVEIPVVAQKPQVATADLESVTGKAAGVLTEPFLVTDGEAYWQITPEAIAGLLSVDDGELAVDRLALDALLATLAEETRGAGQDAAIVYNGDATFAITPETNGRSLDLDASASRVAEAMLAGEHEVELVLHETTPEVTAAELQPLQERANAIAGRGMKVWWADGEQELDRATFASSMRFDLAGNSITFDHATLFAMLEPIAHSINRPASGLRWIDWTIVSPDGALPGRLVDIDSSVQRIMANALGGNPTSELVVDEQQFAGGNAESIAIRDLLGTASTYYGTSSNNRRINVELAAAQLDGSLVAPGGEFSFNQAIGGTATLEDGYQMGFGIIQGEDGNPRTVPSVAGGICQVATTVFQATFWSGLPVGERNWHLYWIPNYGSGPGGMKGLDATVDPDYGLDFTFVNSTSDWVAINAVTDGEWITIEVWGTSQGWEVHADEPQITNVVKADQAWYRQHSDQVPAGQEVVAEHAEDGFNAANHRVVTKDGQVVSDQWFHSYYLPSRNVILVGPGGATGTETPPPAAPVDEPEETPVVEEPEETPTEEPTVEPTEEQTEEPTESPTEEVTEEPTEPVEETPSE